LKQHTLLGMTRQSVRDFLGGPDYKIAYPPDPNQDCYILDANGTCSLRLEMGYSSDKVVRYRYSSMPKNVWFDDQHADTWDWPLFARF
jgi:hypothetical protein